MIERGYRYVDNIASADLVLVEKISDDYDSTMNLRAKLQQAPMFAAVQPFSLISSPFGSDAQLPTGTNSFPLSHPVLNIFIYTKQGKLIYRWAEGGLSNDDNFLHASEHLERRFIDRFPTSKFWSQNLPLGTGRLGLQLRLWSHDGQNFWPDIGRVFPNSPAAAAGVLFGDELLEINGHPMKNVDFRELFRRLRGDVGDTMTIKFFRWSGVNTVQMVMGTIPK
jgi:membrane-associated protease RseP (regulator of RpoE activity)